MIGNPWSPIHVPPATVEQWECKALELTGDVDAAKRLVAARLWRVTKRPAATGLRVIHAPGWPRPEDKCAG